MFNLDDIRKLLNGNYRVLGKSEDFLFDRLSPVLEAVSGSLTFISSGKPNGSELLKNTKASVVICDEKTAAIAPVKDGSCLLVVENPRKAFVIVGNKLFPNFIQRGRHPTAIVNEGVTLEGDNYLGPNVYVGAGTLIGHGTVIQSSTHIYDNANVSIGNNCLIQAGCTIGTDGFGFIDVDGDDYLNFPQIGGVIIEDNVSIHAHANVDRGTLGNTVVGRGTKIDKYCHIGHNVKIGEGCIICGRTLIAGSTIVGNKVWIAPSVTIRDGLKIGSNSVIGLGAVVTKDITEGETVMGVPATGAKDYKTMQTVLKKMAGIIS